MLKDGKLLIPICQDHFLRLAKNDVCTSCPSRAENESVIRAIAATLEQDRDGAMKLLITEIQSIRRAQNELAKIYNEFESIKERVSALSFIIMGADGQNGLRSDVREMRQATDKLKNLVWIGVGVLTTLNIIVPIVVEILIK